MAMEAALVVKSGGGAGAAGVAAQAGSGGERRSRFQRICVYCGSAKGRKPSYQDAAVELGKELVRGRVSSALVPPKKSRLYGPETPVKNPVFSGGIAARSGPPDPDPDQSGASLVPLAPLDCAFAVACAAARCRCAER